MKEDFRKINEQTVKENMFTDVQACCQVLINIANIAKNTNDAIS